MASAKTVFAAGALVTAAGLAVHHAMKHDGKVFCVEDIRNHEFFMALFAALGVGVLIGDRL
jgi:hypothetical protein